jgi:hypothetical protein
MRQAKQELADPERIPQAKLGTGQTPQVGLRQVRLARWQTEHLLASEHQQAVMWFDRGMP